MSIVVKNYFIHHSDEGGVIHVYAGTPTEAVPGQKRIRMIAEDAFEEGTRPHAYVKEYGILVGPENLREKKPTEVDIYGGWILHEDANGAWAIREEPFGRITARRADDLYGLIDADEALTAMCEEARRDEINRAADWLLEQAERCFGRGSSHDYHEAQVLVRYSSLLRDMSPFPYKTRPSEATHTIAIPPEA